MELLTKLGSISILDEICMGRRTGCEENIKIKHTVPLLELLGYDTTKNMDFEHKSGDGSADIGLIVNRKTVLIVETKSLEKTLRDHRTQGLGYARSKGIQWAVLTNGLKIELYRSFIKGVPDEKNEPILVIKQKDLVERFDLLSDYISKESILKIDEKAKDKVEFIQKKITEEEFLRKLKKTKIKLFYDIRNQLEEKYTENEAFGKKVDRWVLEQEIDKNWSWLSKMDKDKTFKTYISDILNREGITISTSVKTIRKRLREDLIFKAQVEKALRENEMPTDWLDKLASEGAYSLINRILFLRMCEDRGFIKKRFTESWLGMVEESPLNETIMHLKSIFSGMATKFPLLYNVPLFDNILVDDLEWDSNSISLIVSETMTHSFADINRDIIGDVYQHHVPKEVRKALGQFYTAQSIVDYMIDEISEFITPDSKIIDPACGSGSFLLSAYNRMKELLIEKGIDITLIHPYIVTNCISGIDIDTFAAQLSLMNIILKDLDHHQKVTCSKIFSGNSLDVGLSQFISSTSDLSDSSAYEDIQDSLRLLNFGAKDGFDIVIGNPPHGNVSSKNPLYAHGLETYYKDIAIGVTNFASMFIKRGIDILRKDGKGYLAFIMPKSFTYTRAFEAVRNYVKAKCQIISLTDLGKAWDEVGLEQVIIVVRRLTENEKLSKSKVKINYGIKDIDFIELGHYKTHFIDVKKFYNSHIFPMYLTDNIWPIYRKITKDSIPLGEIAVNFRGFGVQSKSKISKEKQSEDWVPLVSGSDVKRWFIDSNHKWINLDDQHIKKSRKYERLFTDKIVIMNLVSSKVKIDAAFDNSFSKDNTHPCFNLDTVNNIVLKDEYKEEYDYLYILGVMNSNLITVYFRDFIFNRAELTMHADAPYTDPIPIKKIQLSDQKKISKLVSEIIEMEIAFNEMEYTLETSTEYVRLDKSLPEKKKELNQKIYQIYSLSENEIVQIENMVNL